MTPRSLIWVVRGTVVPETLTELRFESVFSLWLVLSKRTSDLDRNFKAYVESALTYGTGAWAMKAFRT